MRRLLLPDQSVRRLQVISCHKFARLKPNRNGLVVQPALTSFSCANSLVEVTMQRRLPSCSALRSLASHACPASAMGMSASASSISSRGRTSARIAPGQENAAHRRRLPLYVRANSNAAARSAAAPPPVRRQVPPPYRPSCDSPADPRKPARTATRRRPSTARSGARATSCPCGACPPATSQSRTQSADSQSTAAARSDYGRAPSAQQRKGFACCYTTPPLFASIRSWAASASDTTILRLRSANI